MEKNQQPLQMDNSTEDQLMNQKSKGKYRRGNEIQIGEAIKLVNHVREEFNSLKQNNGNKKKVKDIVKDNGYPSGTFNDYQSQLVKGFSFGFNFDLHHNQQINVLRKYN